MLRAKQWQTAKPAVIISIACVREEGHMRRFRPSVYCQFTPALAACCVLVALSAPAHAHHVMSGRTPSTFAEGLLSGLGHPVIGIDHLAVIVALGIVVGVGRMHLALPALFVILSALGVIAHVGGITIPMLELWVGVSVLLVGALLASGRALARP